MNIHFPLFNVAKEIHRSLYTISLFAEPSQSLGVFSYTRAIKLIRFPLSRQNIYVLQQHITMHLALSRHV